MRPKPAVLLILLVAILLVVRSPTFTAAQAAPSLSTDQPLYTLRDKQVALRGAGYGPSNQCFVWLQTPVDSSAHNTTVTFTTTQKGEIPVAVSLPIEPNSPLGTYLVSISNSSKSDTAIARAHYGIWGTNNYVYQRTEIVQAKGGGILPKGAVTVTIRNPAGNNVYKATLAANYTGAFLTTWNIPPDAMVESYTVFMDGTGTYDSPTTEFVSKSTFSITPALLNATVLMQPEALYERTRTASAQFIIRYPDSATVVRIKQSLKPVALYAGQFKIADLGLAASGNATGVWITQFNIPRNASLDVKYKFVLPAKAFDDGNGNTGPEKDVVTGGFNFKPATLQMITVSNSTHYQVPFDTMTAYTQVRYPDGTFVTNATLRAWMTAANTRFDAAVTYDKAAAVWVIRHTFSLADLIRPGSWILSAEATDVYGNTGSTSLEVFAEPYVFLTVVSVIVIALVVARWLLSKYWRRLYLGAKRISSAIRYRWKPQPLGRYLNDSPVTP